MTIGPQPRNAYLLPYLLAAAAALFIAANLVPSVPKPTRLWRGYYILLVREGSEAERRLAPLLPLLSARSVVVSFATSPVRYTDFEGAREVTVAELGSSLDPLDPRFDPYMRGLEGYFKTGSEGERWGIFYIPSYPSAFFLYPRLLVTLGHPDQWRLLELPPLSALVSAIFLAVFSILLARFLDAKTRNAAFLVHLNTVLWAPLALMGGPSAICLVCVELVLWLRLLQASAASALAHSPRGRRGNPGHGEVARELFAYLLISLLLVALAALVFDASPERALAAAAAVLSSLVLALCPFPLYALLGSTRRPTLKAAARKGKKKPSERRRALETAARAVVKAPTNRRMIVAAGAGFALAAFILALSGPGPLPSPLRALVPGAVTWESVRATSPGVGAAPRASDRSGSLPDFRDVVAHEAFQQSLVFGRQYAVPSRDERVTISEYVWSESGRSLVESRRTVRVFDDAWLEGIVSQAGSGSVEGMLLRQQSPFGIALASRWMLVIQELPFSLSCLLLFIALCLFPRAHRPLISGVQWRINRRA